MATPKRPEEKESVGYSCDDPKSGSLFIAESVEKGRTRQVELHSASGAHLKLYKDGGFELNGESNDTADNIISKSKEGLLISAEGGGVKIDAGNGILTLAAREIRFESSASDEPFVIRSANNIILEAQDSIRIQAANIGIGARNKLVLASKGSIWGYGVGGVAFVEQKTALLPTSISDFVTLITTELAFGGKL